MLFGFGIFLLTIAALGLIWNVRISYVTHCGGMGQVPVLAAACIQIPLLTTMGLGFMDYGSVAFNLHWSRYPLLWVGLVVAIGWLMIQVGKIGKSRRPYGESRAA